MGGIFFVLDKFDSILSSVIDSQLPVRIDYIFHDESLKGLSYYRGELTNSDHYPVFMKIAL